MIDMARAGGASLRCSRPQAGASATGPARAEGTSSRGWRRTGTLTGAEPKARQASVAFGEQRAGWPATGPARVEGTFVARVAPDGDPDLRGAEARVRQAGAFGEHRVGWPATGPATVEGPFLARVAPDGDPDRRGAERASDGWRFRRAPGGVAGDRPRQSRSPLLARVAPDGDPDRRAGPMAGAFCEHRAGWPATGPARAD